MTKFHSALAFARALLLGALIGVAGWRGARYLVREGRPVRLLERAAEAAPDQSPSGITIVFLFGPNECPKLMTVLDFLNGIPASRARVVGALTVEEYRLRDWQALVRAEQIRFPVLRLDPGKARAALSSLGYSGGPLLLVFDSAGRVLSATSALDRWGVPELIDRVIDHNRITTVAGQTRI